VGLADLLQAMGGLGLGPEGYRRHAVVMDRDPINAVHGVDQGEIG
jgi:hypothetical protein